MSKAEVKEHKRRSYPNPPLYLDGDCTDVATVGMAVAVSILVALVTACVRVGPPRAELAACRDTKELSGAVLRQTARWLLTATPPYLQTLITISNELLVQRHRILEETKTHVRDFRTEDTHSLWSLQFLPLYFNQTIYFF